MRGVAAVFVVLSIAVIFILLNARWIWLHRHGGVLDIDEAGYLSIAISDYLGYVKGGLLGWLKAVNGPSSQAPVQPAMASILFVIFGPDLSLGFAVSIFCVALTVILSYFLGRNLGSTLTGLLAAFLVATSPLLINFSRSFEFVPAASLATIFALLSLLKSDRMRDLRWAALFGVALAMMPLSRTMTLGFLPGLVAGAVVYVAAEQDDRLKRFANLGLAVALAIAMASVWFIPNGKYVFPYLLSFGYGARAVEYGPAGVSVFSISSWQMTFHDLSQHLNLPHALIAIFGSLSTAYLMFGDAIKSRSISTLFKSPLMPTIVFVVCGLAALTSTSNRGFGFDGPLLPPIFIMASIGLTRIVHMPLRAIVVFCTAAVAASGAFPLIDARFSSDRPQIYDLPILGPIALFDGRSNIDNYQRGRGEPFPSNDEGKAWRKLSEDLALRYRHANAIAFGMRHIFFNTNTISLDQQRLAGVQLANYQFDPAGKMQDIATYLSWLTSVPVSDACILLTSTTQTGSFYPEIDSSVMAEAAQNAGFQRTDSYPMPNKGTVVIWRRPTTACLSSVFR